MDLITNDPCCETKVCESNDIPSRLIGRKRALERELTEVNAAIEAMEKHPNVAEVLTLVSKAIGRY
jgi:hypothetical protein